MMHAMVRRPPQHALLARALRQHRHQELIEAVELVGAMAEVAVVARGDPEHAYGVHRRHQRDVRPAKTNKEDAKRGQVQGRKASDGAKLIVTDCVIQSRTRVQFLKRCLPGEALEEYAQVANPDFSSI